MTKQTRLRPKVFVITVDQQGDPTDPSSEGEAQRWVQKSKINQRIEIPGHPSGLFHNQDEDLCLIVTGLGSTNGAVSLATVLMSGVVDLSDATILISGIGGGNPEKISIGSVAWATWVVAADLASMIERSDLPPSFAYSHFPLGSDKQWAEKKDRIFNLETQCFKLNEDLASQAYQQSLKVELTDNEPSRVYREQYHYPQARRSPFVMQGDILGSNTFFLGNNLGQWSEFWMLSWTEGQGNYVAVDMEDHGIVAALKRFSEAGLLDFNRVLVSRAPYNYERPHANQSTLEALSDALRNKALQLPALENVYRVGLHIVNQIRQGTF